MTAHTPPALEATDLWFSFSVGRPVLRGVSLRAEAGEITMILGISGSGKTTFLKLCKGLLAPRRGTVRVLGERVVAGRRNRLDPCVAYIPQHLGLVRNLGVLDNVLTGALARVAQLPSLLRRLPSAEFRRARELLERVGLGHKADEKAYALSGGERQRVAIARALMQEPRVLLADEFVSQLDVLTSREILMIVRGIASQGVAAVVATHEMELVERYADAVIVLRDGEKVLDRRAQAESIADLALALRR
ncbi:MAG TPA: ATP-binding cassette domain-containing protein [Methylomirabilota bacterium]|nr:ATP-binding cassette domain-containing protein [Methylomirabilota bacterium]